MSDLIVLEQFGEECTSMVFGRTKRVTPHISVERHRYGDPLWTFSENGSQGTGVYISPKMFKALQKLVTDQRVVEHYESIANNLGGDI